MLERAFEALIFASRWLLAPFFFGLVVAIGVLLYTFGVKVVGLVEDAIAGTGENPVVTVLSLVDLALIACLLLIMVFAGYENFVSKLGISDHPDRPAWMGKVGFSDLKLKLVGAIVAISGVELLKTFMQGGPAMGEELYWKIVLHVVFVFSGVMFAVTDWLSDRGKH